MDDEAEAHAKFMEEEAKKIEICINCTKLEKEVEAQKGSNKELSDQIKAKDKWIADLLQQLDDEIEDL
jgi:hypothetical protein